MKVAVISCLDAGAWLPLASGLTRALRELGHDARMWPLGVGFTQRQLATPEWVRVEYEDFKPEFTILGSWAFDLKLYAEWAARAKRHGPLAVFNWDDPSDMETGCAYADPADFVFTPSPEAAKIYKSRGKRVDVLQSWSDPEMFYPRPKDEKYNCDVLWVGAARDPMRAPILGAVHDWCVRNGKIFIRATRPNTLVGPEWRDAMWRSRIVLEIPRDPNTSRRNPDHLLPSYTTPRTHHAAATGACIFAIAPRPLLAAEYPDIPTASAEAATRELARLFDLSDSDRESLGRQHFGRFRSYHDPRFRAERMLQFSGFESGAPPASTERAFNYGAASFLPRMEIS